MAKFGICARAWALALGSVLLVDSVLAAEPYDKRLEFVESTGTQWIDTGLKLHYRNSKAEVSFRLLEVPSATAAICGVTAKKGDASGYTSGSNPRGSFVIRIGRASATAYRILPSFTGGEGGGYRYPDGGTSDFRRNWTVENTWEPSTSADNPGTNMTMRACGIRSGGYYHNYIDAYSQYTYYIGAANNAGAGTFDAEGLMPKVQWFGVKLYTDGELVGNFTPVMKDGVAGFYDTVSQKFFASQGKDAWVAPVEREWIGEGAANDLADTANWKDGVQPSTVHEVAVIPAATTVATNVDAGCAFFTDIGGVRLTGADSILHLDGITASARFNPAVGGSGILRFTGLASVTKGLKFSGSLQTFEGKTEISNLYSIAYCNYGFGDSDLSDTFVNLEGGSHRFVWGSDSMCYQTHGKLHFRDDGEFLFFSRGPRLFGEFIMDHKDAGIHGNGNQTGWFYGKFTGNAVGANTLNPYSGATLGFAGEEKYLNLTQLSLQFNNNIIGCRMHSTPRLHEGLKWNGNKIAGDLTGGQDMANIRMHPNCLLKFQYANALDADCFVQIGYGSGISALLTNVIDLDGYDQQLGTLAVWASTFDPATAWNTNMALKSSAPATLTIYGQLRDDGAAHVFPGRVCGATSVKLDSSEDVMQYAWNWPDKTKAGAIKFNCPGSDTTGSLAVNRGTMEIMATATFSNLTALTVSGTGVMNVKTSAVGNNSEYFKVEIKDSTATLDLAEGVSNVCYTCEIPNGKFLAPGVYSGTEQANTTYCEYLSGAGKLEVKLNGTPWTGWPEAGTTDSVYILRDTAVTIEDSDIPKVQALSRVECGSGVTIDCWLSEGKAIDFKPQFIGDVKIRYWGKGADDELTISGDNSALVAPGGWFLSNCTAKVTHRYGLGTAATAPAEIYSIKDSSRSMLVFDGASVTQNDVALVFVNAAWLYHTDSELEFLQNADITASGLDTSGSRRFVLKHRLALTAGHTANLNTITMSSPNNEPCVFTVATGATLKCIGNFGVGTYVINGSYIGDLRIEQCMTKFVIGRDNAIVSSYSMMYDGSYASFQFDLNGHNIQLPAMCGNGYPNTPWANQQTIPFISDTAATLSLTGNVKTAAWTRGAISFTGAAGCRVATGASQTNRFGKGVSRTTGSLTMDSGLLILEREFRWLGGPVSLNGGEMVVDVTTAPDVFGHQSGTDRTKVVLVPNGGTLKLSAAASTDKTYVYCVQTGTGTYLPAGDYVAGGSGAPAWLTGTGTLCVLHECPPPMGLILFVR